MMDVLLICFLSLVIVFFVSCDFMCSVFCVCVCLYFLLSIVLIAAFDCEINYIYCSIKSTSRCRLVDGGALWRLFSGNVARAH